MEGEAGTVRLTASPFCFEKKKAGSCFGRCRSLADRHVRKAFRPEAGLPVNRNENRYEMPEKGNGLKERGAEVSAPGREGYGCGMRFCRNLWVGGSIRDPEKVKWKLKHNAGQFSVYVIALAAAEGDQLDIIHCGYLKQRCFDTDDMFVVGLASSRQEAVEIVASLAGKVVRETGDADLKGYFLKG